MYYRSLTTLRQLRMLTPQRPLTFTEACDRAELQAIALLARQDLTRPPVPIDLVVSLPRISVTFEAGLPYPARRIGTGTPGLSL